MNAFVVKHRGACEDALRDDHSDRFEQVNLIQFANPNSQRRTCKLHLSLVRPDQRFRVRPFVDVALVSVIDSLELGGEVTYRKY